MNEFCFEHKQTTVHKERKTFIRNQMEMEFNLFTFKLG